MTRAIAPHGSWASPIDARMIAEGSIGLSEVRFDGEDLYWLELRPKEGGRLVIVRRRPDGSAVDLIAPPFNARTRVHEYGGGSYLPLGQEVLFTNFADQRVYRVPSGGGEPRPVTPEGLRYADFEPDHRHGRILAVREDHRGDGQPVNTLVAIDLAGGGEGQVLISGSDFFSSPRLSGDGSMLAWLSWDHPDMPWDAAELWAAEVRGDGSIGQRMKVAGGAGESIIQPEWLPGPGSPALVFASDRTDWWNLHLWRDGRVRPLTEMPAEFALPQWVFCLWSYGVASQGRLACSYMQDGRSHLCVVDAATGGLTPVDAPYDAIRHVRASGGRAAFIGASAARPWAVVLLDLATGRSEELRRSFMLDIDEGFLSSPRPVEFPTTGGRTAHGLFYPPANRNYAGLPGEKPPLVVEVHGGPTSATSTALRLGIQYYTSRGLAVLDVNYGGSTGYGRAYRQRLDGQWGVVDVDDCCHGARYLAEAGLADGRRMAISGGSAGGYTVLSCLTFRDVFAAGASHFGISDCEAMARETHKFESRYLDKLIAPYPQRRDVYIERSPIHHVEGLRCPVIFFQGLEDKIVPPNQARLMADALRAKGVPVALIEFAGEQHGFRKAENIRRALEAELYFFSVVFGFAPADELEGVAIENL